MTTYEQLHAGDHVLGYDGDTWGVAEVIPDPLCVTIVKPGERLVARPPAGTEITVLHAQDVSAEAAAWGVLAAAGLAPQVIGEYWA